MDIKNAKVTFTEEEKLNVFVELTLKELDRKIASLEGARSRNPFCTLRDLFTKA